jgi:TolA-binding protein
VHAGELHVVDKVLALFQRWHDHLAPPEEDDRHGRRPGRQPAPEAHEEAPAPSAAAAPHHRLRTFLLIVGLMAASAAIAGFLAYRVFARMMESDSVLIDDLRDQIVQLEKADRQNVSRQAKDQQQLAELRKTLREKEVQIQENEDEISALKEKVAALAAAAKPAPTITSSRVTRAPVVTPQSARGGNCVASGPNAAADLARCVQNFNRP